MDFQFRRLSYRTVEYDKPVEHYIMMVCHNKKNHLLSIPNIYLYEKTRSSTQTSKRYATLLTKFYKFASGQPHLQDISPGDYHAYITNKDIKRWQIYRQIQRVKNKQIRPSSETIFNDACVVAYFFKWLHERNIAIQFKINLKTWVANFKDHRLLSYIEKKARHVMDTSSIRVLDRESRQRKAKSLISAQDITTLLGSYPDPVYKCLFKFALATAMRPMELVKFPYMGTGKNRHILPYSEMDKTKNTFTYDLIGKRNKHRKIIIPAYALEMLNTEYIQTEYHKRTGLYRKKYGHKCPLSILFLTERGEPVTVNRIAQATNYAKELAVAKDPKFETTNIFYHTRKWWPTLMMIQHHGREGILEKNAEVLDLAIAEVITNQMGHDDLTTTYNHYLVLGRLLVLATKGFTHETIHEKTINVLEGIEDICGQQARKHPSTAGGMKP
jgi:integrase